MADWSRRMSEPAIARRALALAWLGCLPLSTFAQSLDACRSLKADSERLACYDALATNANNSTGPTLPPSEALSPTPVETAAGSLKAPGDEPISLLGQAWELDAGQRGHILRIRPYKPVYVLPWFHTTSTNTTPTSPAAGHTGTATDLSSTEAKFQFSLKTKLLEDVFGSNGDLWFGYTQTSRWQVYHGGTSRPFRETNHEPEAMLLWRTDYQLGGWRGRYLSLGVNHQSNGRALPLSRSWNRVMAAVALENDGWTLTVRPWWRIPESTNNDDNPDISNYLGRADLLLVKRWGDRQFSALLRHSLRSGENSHGAVQLDYAFPIAGSLRGHLQWFSGYGESMIDYNHRANYYGVGLSLLEWY